MGRHQLRLLKFAIRYLNEWHTFGTDSTTVSAVKSLVKLGLLEVNDFRQFTLKKQ